MERIRTWLARQGQSLTLAARALRAWGPRQIVVAVIASVAVAVVVGMVTVLIPNTLFTREIAPVAWNQPVWLVTSALTGILIATYVRPAGAAPDGDDAAARRGASRGAAGGALALFAVGCPVCNKLAVLALGYTGAMTWFAPLQPLLAVAALALSGVAVVARLRGQVACPVLPTAAVPA